jgi:serine/threonine-protein kinase
MEGLVTHIKGDAAAAKKAFEAARALYEKELRDDPESGPRVVMLGMVDAALGRNREALQEGRRALELSPLTKDSLDGVDVLYFYAVTCAWTGERDLAIEELQTLAKTPGGLTYGDALFSLYWDSLRGDPRFEKIVASLKPSDVPVAFATLPEKSIAVLPFANLSSNKENAYFASGVQDELLSNLARIADLKVISRTSVTQYESSSPRNIREIGQALGVANIVEGSVQRMGNRVRVIAQLIDTRTDTHLWSETYDRDLSDVFAIQDEIAQKIADQLRAKISPREKAAIEKQPTRDLEAYKLYLEATGLIDKSGPLEGEEQKNLLLKAVELLNQAVARDPRFLLAYCRLAEAHDAFYLNGIDHTPARLALAKSAIDSAFKLEPDSGDAHLALAIHLYHGYFDYDRARDELDLALRTLPNNARIYEWSGYIDRRQNRWRDAVRNFNHALELDPQNLKILLDAQATYFNLRDYNKERQLRRRLVSLDPDYSAEKEKSLQDVLERADTRAMHAALKMKSPTEPRFELARFVLALWEHDAAEAERTLPAVSAQYADAYIARDVGSTTFSRDYLRGLIARMRGDAAAAQKAFTAARLKQEAAIRESPDINTRLSVLGLIDAGLGRKEDALREGREAVELVPPEKEAFDAADVRYYYAVICAWVGERDLAIEQLEASAKMPGGVLYHEIRLDPHWDPLRGNPRFEKIASSLTPKETKQ